jgi:hypothetical protein
MAFSCKKRGFCPSCGARRMAESARHLAEQVFGPRPVRQWVLSFPFRPLRGNARVARCAASPLRDSFGPLRFLFASKLGTIGPVLAIVHRVIARWLADQTGIDRTSAVRRGDVDPVLRQRAQPQCPLSHAVARWRV